MNLPKALAPKYPVNLAAAAAASSLVVAASVVALLLAPFSPKRGVGLLFGFLAAGLYVFAMMYPSRGARALSFMTARGWAQAHVYFSSVALFAVLAHTGFGLPHGGVGWLLLALSLWTTLSGVLGVALQKGLPMAMATGLKVEALYERIPDIHADLVREAEALVEGAGESLEGFYRREVEPGFASLRPSWSYLFDVRAGRDRALAPFQRMSQFASPEDKERVNDLMAVYTEKLELDAQLRLQSVLRGWLWLHVPPAGLLMGLLALHVFTWIRY